MERIFKRTLSKVRFKLQQIVFEISSRIKSIVSTMNPENESTEPQRAFYLFSLMLLIFLIFLSPDKIAQTLTLTRADIGILEKAQEITKIIRRLMPNFG